MNYSIFKIASKSKVALLIKFAGIISSLVLSVLISKELGLVTLGQYNFFNQTISIISVVSIFGFNSQISKRFPILLKRKIYLALNSYLVNILFTVFIFSLFFGIILTLLLLNNPVFNFDKSSILLIGINIVPSALTFICSFILIAFGKIWQSALTKQGIVQIIALVFTVILIKVNALSLDLILIIIFGLRLTLAIWMIYYINSIVNLSFNKLNFPLIKKIVYASVPLAVTSIITIVQNNWETFVIPINFSDLEYAYYSTGSRIVFILTIFLTILNSTILKKISTRIHSSFSNHSDTQKILTIHSRRLTLLGVLFLTGMIIFGKYILLIWGIENDIAYYTLLILSFGQLINLTTAGAAQLLVISGNTIGLMKIKLIEFIVLILSTIIFIKTIGLLGLALSSIISSMISNFTMVFYGNRKTNLKALPF